MESAPLPASRRNRPQLPAAVAPMDHHPHSQPHPQPQQPVDAPRGGTLKRSSSFKKILKLWGSGSHKCLKMPPSAATIPPKHRFRTPSYRTLDDDDAVRLADVGAKLSFGERPASGPRPDRRPDTVNEERAGAGAGSAAGGATHDPDDECAHQEQPSHHVTKSKPSATSINRSESYKERIHQKRQLRERRKTSDPNLSKSNQPNDVDLEAQALSYSGSSSNSSLSTRSLDSPSNSLEAVTGGGSGGGHRVGDGSGVTWDSDGDGDADPPDWKHAVPEDMLKELTPHEIKRQEVLNELFQTERSHVRGLKVLDRVFHRPMMEQQILPPDQISLLFSNLEEMLEIHSQFNNCMKAKRKEGPVIGEVGDLLYNMFEGEAGEHFQQAAATFCARQQFALESLKEKRRKDPKLNNFLTDAELNPVCRRLQLKDIIPSGMLRLTKYPLLLKNVEKYTTSETEEAVRVQRAEERSREILSFVNAAVKEAEDHHRLAEIQRRLDKGAFDKADHPIASEFKNLDLTRHRLIHEGPLNWRLTPSASRPKLIDLHVLLLEDVIILLQKQDDKYVLKFYSSTLSPVIKVSTVIVRPNAVDKKAMFLVNTSGAQIYDLVATSSSEKKLWFKHISDAAEAYKTREGKHRRQDTTSHDDSLSHDKTKDSEESGASGSELLSPHRANGSEEAQSPASENTTPHASPSPQPTPTPTSDTPESTASKLGEGLGSPSPSAVRRVAEPLRQTTAESCLIEPSEVVICQSPVLTAEPVLTPLEKLRRADEAIEQALEEKQRLVAEILHVPKADYDAIADIAAEPSTIAGDKEPAEILLAAINQANKLSSALNEALGVTEEEAVSASADSSRARLPGVPAHQLHQISTTLNSQLSLLLNIMTARDEERERLRQEVQRSREQLHALYERKGSASPHDPGPEGEAEDETSTPASEQEPVTAPALALDMVTDQVTPTQMPTTPEVYVDALTGETDSVAPDAEAVAPATTADAE